MNNTNQKSSFGKKKNLLIAIILVTILAIGAFLRLYQLGASGVGNQYYAAAVKSMLQSWHNFFFVAFEPGGSLSLDKPPLGFWVQALSAYLLGFSGFSLALPNALAGVLSIYILYQLVAKPFGNWIGLLSSLVLALMPVAVSTERNNTIDGLLVCVLLLAAWAFLKAISSGKLTWLLLGAGLVGIGFNIKMLQAVIPLPAFYAAYFFAARLRWWRKLLNLCLATLLLLVISFSWAVAVDLVPAVERPYVDSTSNNTVMELIFGHNGVERLISLRSLIRNRADAPDQRLPYAPPGGNPLPLQPRQALPGGDRPYAGSPVLPPLQVQPRPGQEYLRPPDQNLPGRLPGGQGGTMDFGTPGKWRLFSQPLAGEVSWWLPFILVGLILLVIIIWKQPFGEKQVSLILWAAWLLPTGLYFTYCTGLMHAYYLIMLAPPAAALVGLTVWALWELILSNRILGWMVLFLLSAGTLGFQAVILLESNHAFVWIVIAAASLQLVSLLLMFVSRKKDYLRVAAVGLLMLALLLAPGFWSFHTTMNDAPNLALPSSGPAIRQDPNLPRGRTLDVENSRLGDALDYLLANTDPGTYLLAVNRANEAAPYILATGRPVLSVGGFMGQYQTVTVDQLASLVESGQLRFILGSAVSQFADMRSWVESNCSVDRSLRSSLMNAGNQGNQNQLQLPFVFDCKLVNMD